MGTLGFNQDGTCCVVSRNNRVEIYNCEPFGKCFEWNSENETDAHEDGYLVEMLFSTSLIGIVSRSRDQQASHKLKIINTKRSTIICELNFPGSIVDIAMNRKRLCVLLDSGKIFIYDISCMKVLETLDLNVQPGQASRAVAAVTDTHDNLATSLQKKKTYPLMALSHDDRSILCYTTNATNVESPTSVPSNGDSKSSHDHRGLRDVVIYDALNLRPINYLNSLHKTSIACLTISPDGQMIATASVKGTIIRIFRTDIDSQFNSCGSLYAEFRRGSRPSKILQLIFSPKSELLACTGDTGTVHIFKLSSEYERNTQDPTDSTFGKGLPKFLSKKLQAHTLDRDYAHLTLEGSRKCVIAFPEEFQHLIYVLTDANEFRIYTIGEGKCMIAKLSSIC